MSTAGSRSCAACSTFRQAQDPLPVGSGAKAILALRRILPDRLYDAAVKVVLKRVAAG
jgi:hypothetical protein